MMSLETGEKVIKRTGVNQVFGNQEIKTEKDIMSIKIQVNQFQFFY